MNEQYKYYPTSSFRDLSEISLGRGVEIGNGVMEI